MITVFSGTNRSNNRTKIIADFIYQYLKEQANEEVRFFSLEDLPTDFVHAAMYSADEQSPAIKAIQDEFLIPANKFYFVVPEYNGGIPGILKLFLDACSIREYAASFQGGKKAALVGVSAGRSGCLRGMEYMTGFLSYLQIAVMPNRLPVSTIEKLLENDALTDEATQKVLRQQADQFLTF